MKRLRMHGIKTVDGRQFVQFIALILMSVLSQAMRAAKLIKKYTVRDLLEMDPLTEIHYEGKFGRSSGKWRTKAVPIRSAPRTSLKIV
ncbi:MAG: hypothetical protein ACOYM2_09820 [Rectinemataceae bacterium]